MGCLKLSYYPTTELKIISSKKVLTLNKTKNNSRSSYRFGFNKQEKVDEISGAGNHTTATYWEYDTRLGRRWNLDPKLDAWESPYVAFADNPIRFSDILGDTEDERKKAVENHATAPIRIISSDRLKL